MFCIEYTVIFWGDNVWFQSKPQIHVSAKLKNLKVESESKH